MLRRIQIVLLLNLALAINATANLEPSVDIKIDRYYYPLDIAKMDIQLTKSINAGAIFEIFVRLGTDVIARNDIPVLKDQQQYNTTFDISNWPTGRFIVSAQLKDKTGKDIADIRRVIYRQQLKPSGMPARHLKPTISPDGAFILDGKLFFPFFVTLLAQSPPTGQTLKCFNVKPAENDTLCAMAVDNPLNRPMVELPGDMNRNGDNVFIILPEEKIMDDKVREFIENYKSTPSILCWLIKYESRISLFRGEKPDNLVALDNAAEYNRLNQVIKKCDRNHLTSIHINYGEVEHLREYENVADVIELADGRLPGSSYAEQLVPNIADFVKNIRELLGPSKPFIFWIGSSIPDARYRTAEEIRCATYLAIMHGASGIVYHMGHGGIAPSYTRHWSVYSGLAAEVEQLYPIIKSTPHKPNFTVKMPDSIDTMIRFPYIIAVNTTNVNINATFTVKDCNVLELPCENRKIYGKKSVFSDMFTAFEPHMYFINNGASVNETVRSK